MYVVTPNAFEPGDIRISISHSMKICIFSELELGKHANGDFRVTISLAMSWTSILSVPG